MNDYRFSDIEDVRYHVDYFIRFYNERRIRQSLGYLEPSTISSHVEIEELFAKPRDKLQKERNIVNFEWERFCNN